MESEGEVMSIYNARDGINRDTALDSLVRRWMHWGGRSAILRRDEAVYIDVPFKLCVEEYGYNERLYFIISQRYTLPSDESPVCGISYVSYPQHFELVTSTTWYNGWLRSL